MLCLVKAQRPLMDKSEVLPPQATGKSLTEGLELIIQKLLSQIYLILSGPQGKNQGINSIYIHTVKIPHV